MPIIAPKLEFPLESKLKDSKMWVTGSVSETMVLPLPHHSQLGKPFWLLRLIDEIILPPLICYNKIKKWTEENRDVFIISPDIVFY